MFLWPLVVFRKYLRGKSVTFKFSFCVTAQVVIINTVVLMLGLVHLLNDWTLRILFYGTFLYSLREYFALTPERKRKIKYLLNGSFGWKNFFFLERRKYVRILEEFGKKVWKFYKRHWLEYSMLVVALLYGMVYFSWGAFHNCSYGFGDVYVHHSWIYGLVEGKIFSAGVYPEAMHCVVYSMHTLFGIDIYSSLLFLAGIHIVIILLAAYCFMKEIFHWRFSPVFALILFLILDVACVDEVFSMSRLQWTLPQEYGFHTIYLCALYLLRYLISEKKGRFKKKETKGCWDENLLVFLLALAASIVIHFYVTIMAFFLCAAVALCTLKRIFSKTHFWPLVAGVIIGVIIAVTPMVGALASGIPFQGSIGWAVNVINGTDTGEGRTHAVQSGMNAGENAEVGNQPETVVGGSDSQIQVDGANTEVGNMQQEEVSVPAWKRYLDKGIYIIKRLLELFREKALGVYENGYVLLYENEQAGWIIGATAAVLLCCASYHFYYFVRKLKKLSCKEKKPEYGLGYPIIILASIIFMIVYAAPLIGLPELIAGARLCSTEQLLIIMVFVIVFDILFMVMAKRLTERILQRVSAITAVVLVVAVCVSGRYHGYLYFELTRYSEAVDITNEIMEALPQNAYTIVSTTDEIYQVIQDGRHEEVLTFLNSQEEDLYTLPTEYVFFFVEKKPIQYAQIHFCTGPRWMATNKYEQLYPVYSTGNEVLQSEISSEAARKEILTYGKMSRAYSELESRTILESKLYEWCRQFEEAFPFEMKVYYEDDNFVCYYVQQNVKRLYELGL